MTSIRFAVKHGDGWVTTGLKGDDQEGWWASLADLNSRVDEALERAGRDRATLPRYLQMDAGHQFSLESVGVFEDMVGRAGELGFTDVITHWPRPDTVYVGSLSTLEEVASRVALFSLHRRSFRGHHGTVVGVLPGG